jgi:FkbM family methyltransferase
VTVSTIKRRIRTRVLSPLLGPYRRLHRRYVLRTERLASTPYAGATFFYPSRSIIGRAIAEGRGWDVTLPRIVDALLPEDPVVIEVGSNIGASLVQIKRARPSAVVHCCEPSGRFAPILRRNIASYGWADVDVLEAVLASDVERRPLYSNTSTASLVAAEYGSHEFLGSETVETTTLDLAFATLKRLNMVKIDTDGFDYDVLLGGERLLTQFHPVVHFEFAPKLLDAAGRSPHAAIAFVQSLGYRTLLVLEPDGTPLATSSDAPEIVDLARERNYVDVVAVHETSEQGLRSLEGLMDRATHA